MALVRTLNLFIHSKFKHCLLNISYSFKGKTTILYRLQVGEVVTTIPSRLRFVLLFEIKIKFN
jgi:hypothetical protein